MLNSRYAQVIVDVPDLDTRTFSYLIPQELQGQIKPGVPVLVPFGTRGVINAFVVGFSNYLPEGIKAKYIYEILDNEPLFDIEYLKLLEWVSNYYCCDLQTVIDAAIPSNLFSKTKRNVHLLTTESPHITTKDEQKIHQILLNNHPITTTKLHKTTKITYQKFYNALRNLQRHGIVEINNIIEEKKSKPKLEKFVRIKETGEEIKLTEYLIKAETTRARVKTLAKKGIVEIFDKEVYRNPTDIFKTVKKQDFFELTASQEVATKKIIDNDSPEPLLLYGVTGSGKTEVYMHAVKDALENDKSVIILAPEIILASQLAQRFAARFGSDSVAIWHSSISDGEKYDVWKRLRSGEIKIIIGARSAIFAPIKDLGLIIIDEEHESSYKQTSPTPRYNAKTIAQERAKREGAMLVLGTATPDITTYFRAKSSDRVILLPERIGQEGMPTVRVVDMRKEIAEKNKSIFSRSLKRALIDAFEDNKQAILLINRRGFSTYGQCTNCGYTPKCERCDIPLILHKTGNKLRCHYCNYEVNAHELCPSCSVGVLKYYGMGTQKVEELFKREFPQMRVKRIDSDIMSRKNAHIEILNEFSNGEIDVLIGTQMIAKGLDVNKVVLVGVISADSIFNIPDFRGAERGFQLLTQVAGRAGRGDFSGKVYFQTYTPDFFAINCAQEQDFLRFYDCELEARNDYSYPPFSGLIRFIISAKEETKAIRYSTDLTYRLKLITNERGLTERLEVLGPSRCIINKIKDEYRFQVLIKNTLGENGHFMLSSFIKSLKVPADIKFLIDVDPSDML